MERPEALAEEFFKGIIAKCVLEEVAVHWTTVIHSGNRKERESEDDQRHCANGSGQFKQVIYNVNLMVGQTDWTSECQCPGAFGH